MLFLSRIGAPKVLRCCLCRPGNTSRAPAGSTRPYQRRLRPRCLRRRPYPCRWRLQKARSRACAAGVTSGHAGTTPSLRASSPLRSCHRLPIPVRPCLRAAPGSRRGADISGARPTLIPIRQTPRAQRSLVVIRGQVRVPRGAVPSLRMPASWTRSAPRMRLWRA